MLTEYMVKLPCLCVIVYIQFSPHNYIQSIQDFITSQELIRKHNNNNKMTVSIYGLVPWGLNYFIFERFGDYFETVYPQNKIGCQE